MLPQGIRRRFRLYRGHRDVESDIRAEIEFHLLAKTEALIAMGMRPEAARDEALRQFGDVRRAHAELAAIDHRDTERRLRTDWLEAAWSDLRFAARSLARTPGFTAVVVLTLALGIGATAGMFGVLDRLLLRTPIGVADPEHVVRLFVRQEKSGPTGTALRWQFLFQELHLFDGADSIGSVAFWGSNGPAPLTDDVGALSARVTMVSGAYFQVLRVRPALGRSLVPADDSASSPLAAVVSYALWNGRYAASPVVIGRVIHVKGRAYTIVGVAPRGFSGLANQTVDVWLPVNVAAEDLFGPILHNPRVSMYAFSAAARMKPGIPRDRVAGELTLAVRRHLPPPLSTPLGPLEPQPTVVLGSIIPGRAQVELGRVGASMRLSLLVGGVALIVCLIAMANVANLLLLRALGRRRETGIRIALGVSRWRLVRAVLLESLLLAAVAGAAAAYVASAGGELLRKLLVHEDWAAPLVGVRVFGFVALAAFLVGTFTGLVPALLGGKPDVLASLRAGVRLSAWRRSRVRGMLMVGQVALTLALLAAFGLFARSLERAKAVGFGVDAAHLLAASPGHTETAPPSINVDDLLAQVRRLPGVSAAAAEETALPMYSYAVRYLRAEGVASVPNSTSEGGPFFSQIGPGYLETVGLRALRGRSFATGEFVAPATVALVSEEMARRLWPGQDAIGKCLYIQMGTEQPPCSSIVGIIGNVRQAVTDPPLMQYYVPLPRGLSRYPPEIVVRTVGDPDRMVELVTSVIKSASPHLADQAVLSIPDRLGDQFHDWQLGTVLFAMFGGLALLVAMVGLYSVVAFDGAQRTHEFGIRIALGARGWDVARLLLAQGLRYGGIGLLLGLALVAAGGRLIGPQLFHTSSRDPVALGAVACLLLASVVVACVVPAHSAVQVDPRSSLQAE